jgi:hypothetical protein
VTDQVVIAEGSPRRYFVNPMIVALRRGPDGVDQGLAEYEAYIAEINADAERRKSLPKQKRGVIYLPDRTATPDT